MFCPSVDAVARNMSTSSSINAVDVQETQSRQTISVAPAALNSIASASADLAGPQEVVRHNIPTTGEVHYQLSSPLPKHHAASTTTEAYSEPSSPLPEQHIVMSVAEVHRQPISPVPDQQIISTVAEVSGQQSLPLPGNHNNTGAEANDKFHNVPDPMDQIETFQEKPIISPVILHNISNTHVSHIPLINISPLPKATHTQTRRKNASKSEIITSSPFKNSLEEKQKKKKIEEKAKKTKKPKLILENKKNKEKQEEIENSKIIKKPKMNTRSKPKKKNETRKDKTIVNNSQQDYYCPLCREKYGDTSEDWIECSICKTWWHETCTSYEQGTRVFFVQYRIEFPCVHFADSVRTLSHRSG
ncbi:hypothetical protein HF086_017079 [Spodoptera exigua]|uniref:Zinc finger PHD-type domain-containing protein n=1 Tax=Spodoptera exigua TaxID=7107 RepID=A0A922MHC8_SPOEX|nr:hypothetical protein HF086_017079 [Spodoptera exigua]